MTPPAAIKPTGEEISKAWFVMVRPDECASMPAAVFHRLAQFAVLSGVDERQNFRDRRIRTRQIPDLVEAFGKDAGAVKQLLIERTYGCEPLARKFAAFHSDDVETFKTGILAVGQTKWNHVAADAANAADHRLRPDPDELVNCRQAAHVDKIADLAMAA